MTKLINVKFKDVQKGVKFFLNGNYYIKKSKRTAYLLPKNQAFFIGLDEIVQCKEMLSYESSRKELLNFIDYNVARLDNDYCGNPRYWITQCNVNRPKGGKVYRGKKYGAGWVIQSYNINADIHDLMNEQGLY